MMHLLHDAQIDRYFGRGLRPGAAARMLRRIWRCAACRARYERHLLFESALPGSEGRREDRLWQAIRKAADEGSGRAGAGHTVQGIRRWAVLAATGAVALFAFASQRALKERTPSSTARGAPVRGVAPPALHLFRTVGERQTEPVDRSIRANDGILFAYSNPGSELGYLMVLAVDGQGTVYWYYPAYERPGENPTAAAIRTRALGIELGEEIRQALPVGPLRIFGLFLARPWHVDQIERLVAQAWTLNGRSLDNLATLPLTEGEQISLLLEVTK